MPYMLHNSTPESTQLDCISKQDYIELRVHYGRKNLLSNLHGIA